ncbi:MAG: DMT family transporter [Clostridiales bacterium]|nr:DMT family transporter [Clostridiales bacterium]
MVAYVLPVLAAILCGISLALQPIFNSNVSKSVGLFNAAFISILVSLTIAIIMCLVTDRFQGLSNFGEVNKIYLVAGVFGVMIVALMIYAVSRVGPALTFSVVIAAQMTVATVCAHFGFFNQTQESISLIRVLGIIFLIVGVVLIKISK